MAENSRCAAHHPNKELRCLLQAGHFGLHRFCVVSSDTSCLKTLKNPRTILANATLHILIEK